MHPIEDGLDALRRAVWAALAPQPVAGLAGGIVYAETAAPGWWRPLSPARCPARSPQG